MNGKVVTIVAPHAAAPGLWLVRWEPGATGEAVVPEDKLQAIPEAPPSPRKRASLSFCALDASEEELLGITRDREVRGEAARVVQAGVRGKGQHTARMPLRTILSW